MVQQSRGVLGGDGGGGWGEVSGCLGLLEVAQCQCVSFGGGVGVSKL